MFDTSDVPGGTTGPSAAAQRCLSWGGQKRTLPETGRGGDGLRPWAIVDMALIDIYSNHTN